ncbi:MAG: bacteriohemerythrin, partial [bacterium]|nr:bacteriohemerythrin [bacterium]
MALFEWKDTYGVNVKEVDKQHKMLVGMLNELHEAMLSRQSKELLAGIIKGMVDYAGIHFSFEETRMKKFGYKHYDAHKKSHAL